MQSAAERDNYVEIVWDNIQTAARFNFEKFNDTTVSMLGIPYDYMSLMHYKQFAFAIDHTKPTIITRNPYYQDLIGQNKELSAWDIQRINRMYNC
jgi:hypothetical protein